MAREAPKERTTMYTLSAFGDEIGPDLQEQMEVLSAQKVRYLELRGAWGKNVMEFSDEDVRRAQALLARYDIRVSAIGSPIGKIKITDNFDEHLEKFRRAARLAQMFGTQYVRVFSYYPPEGGKIQDHRDEVVRRTRLLAEEAEKEGVILGLENELDLYGENPEGNLDLLNTVNSPHLRAVFDPANYIIAGIRPYDRAYPLLKEWIEYFHIKDAFPGRQGEHFTCVPAGEGQGQISRILADFAPYASRRRTFLTLEPHLSSGGRFSGFTGPAKFVTAVEALRRILSDIGASYG